jgi:RNA polymerase sigma-70 factor, ECF subfamily
MEQHSRDRAARERVETPTTPAEEPPQTQEEALFAALVTRSGPRLLALGLALTGERAAAEDLVQEALIRVWHRRRSLAPGALDGYVLATVRNLGANRRERLAVEARALERGRAESRPETRPPGEGDVWVAVEALATLPEEQREVVLLRIYEGLAFKDVAARTKAPLGTVHSRYRLALERLRSLLGGGP